MNDSPATGDKTKRDATSVSNNSLIALVSNPYLILLLAPLFWGGNTIVGKLAVGHIDPVTLVVLRWVGAVLVLTPIALPHVRRDWPRIKSALFPLFAFGALGFATFNFMMYTAALYTTAVNASIEQASLPVFVFIANLALFAVRPKALQVLGLGLTILGVIWVATHGQPGQILTLGVNIGDALVVLACLIYALYSILLRYKPDIHWLSFIFVTASSALVTSLLFQIPQGGLPDLAHSITQITTAGWLCVAYAMIFPSIVAQLFYVRGVEMVGPNRASVFINLIPIFGTIMSILIVGEIFHTYHLVASILVVAGIILAEYAVRSKVHAT